MNKASAVLADTHSTDIGPYSFDEFVEAANRFHGYAAPGLLLGGHMVAAAQKRLPEGILFDAVSETAWCLPDAVQMLTPCTIGNGWLRVLNLGLYAVTLYDKTNGKGFRVSLDMARVAEFPEMETWLLKSKPKKEQDSDRLRWEIREGGNAVCAITPVMVDRERMSRTSKGAIARCPSCGAAYPAKHGRLCRMCSGEGPYLGTYGDMAGIPGVVPELPPELKSIPVDQAVNKKAAHDMTRIVPGKSKGVAFFRGQSLDIGDVCRLQQLGRYNVYVSDGQLPDPAQWVHEDEAAQAFARAMAGPGVEEAGPPREGKVTLVASVPGVLTIDRECAEAFNMVENVMAACRRQGNLVDKGDRLGATRAIPLYLARDNFLAALRVLRGSPIFSVMPMRRAKVGILVTGTEIVNGLIQDKFGPIISSKVKRQGCQVMDTIIVADKREDIRQGVDKLLAMGTDLLVTTAGLSVDPDDVTRKGLVDAGATDLLYGAPILPGAMTLLARIGSVQVIGVPACALFYKTTSFDLLLPKLLASVPITRKDMARMSLGGMCMECKTCTFPKCQFGN